METERTRRSRGHDCSRGHCERMDLGVEPMFPALLAAGFCLVIDGVFNRVATL